MIKKLLCFSMLVIVGLVGFSSKVDAVAYDESYKNFSPTPEANAEAIRIVQENGGLKNSPIPIENLTVEQPKQFNNGIARKSLQVYRANGYTEIFNMYQWRINELAPVGFTWYENGIPEYVTKGFGQALTFNSARITDTNVGGWQYGYYWRQFSCAKGTFWVSVWDKNDLLY